MILSYINTVVTKEHNAFAVTFTILSVSLLYSAKGYSGEIISHCI